MTDSKPGHTPGPWADFDDYEVSVDAESNVGNRLCGWFVIGNPERANGEVAAIIHFEGTPEEEYIANGHLIASAPALLEALEELAAFSDNKMTTRSEMVGAITKARAAIRLARGEG